MTENGESQIVRLRQAIYALEEQVGSAPVQARELVDAALSGGIDYAVHAVSRLTKDVQHITQRAEVTGGTR